VVLFQSGREEEADQPLGMACEPGDASACHDRSVLAERRDAAAVAFDSYRRACAPPPSPLGTSRNLR